MKKPPTRLPCAVVEHPVSPMLCFAASGMPLGFIDAGAMVAGKIEGDGNERDEKAEHDVKNVESEMVKTHGASIEAFGPQNLMQNAGVRQDSGLFLKVLKKTG